MTLACLLTFMVMYIVASSRIKYCRGSKTIPAYLSFAIRLLPPPSYFRGEDPDAATSVNQYHVCVGSSHSFHVKKKSNCTCLTLL